MIKYPIACSPPISLWNAVHYFSFTGYHLGRNITLWFRKSIGFHPLSTNQQREGRFCDEKVREDSALHVLFKSDSSDRGADAGGNPLNTHS